MNYDEKYPKELIIKDGEDEYEIKIVQIEKRNTNDEDKDISEEPKPKTSCWPKWALRLNDIVNEIYGYFPLIAYTGIFIFLSVLPDNNNVYCLYFASLSVIVLLNEEIRKHRKSKNAKRNSLFLTFGFACLLVGLIVSQKKISIEASGIVSNVVSGVVLLTTIILSMEDDLKDSKVLNHEDK